MRELSFKEMNYVAGGVGATVDAKVDLGGGVGNQAMQVGGAGYLAWTQAGSLGTFLGNNVAFLGQAANPLAAVCLFAVGYVAIPHALKLMDGFTPK